LIDTIGAVQIDNWVKMADFYSLGAARAGVLLELHCAVSASATVRIGAAAAVDAGFRADSTAGLRISGRAELAARAEIAIAADVVDVVLEMLLLDA